MLLLWYLPTGTGRHWICEERWQVSVTAPPLIINLSIVNLYNFWNIWKLQLVQNVVARIVLCKPRFARVTSFAGPALATNFLPDQFKVILVTLKALHGLGPCIWRAFFSQWNPPDPPEPGRQGMLWIPSPKEVHLMELKTKGLLHGGSISMEHHPCKDKIAFHFDTILQGPENKVLPKAWRIIWSPSNLPFDCCCQWGGEFLFFCIVFISGFYPCKPLRVIENKLGSHINFLK